MLNAYELIEAERQRQQLVEGYTDIHNKQHDRGELAKAADCYRQVGMSGDIRHANDDQSAAIAVTPRYWPFGEAWWKPKSRLRNLVRAGALYNAEIDRIVSLREIVANEIQRLL